MAVRTAQGRAVPFQNDVGLQPLRQVAGFQQPFEAVGRMSLQAVELLGVRCEDNILWQLLNPRPMVGQNIDGISIADQRALGAAQL